MITEKKASKWGVICLVILATFLFMEIPLAQAQYWQALPPYNLLWPLWSPLLSPLTTTGMPVPVPLLTSLDNTTVLPVQPVLAWDPAQMYPWLLYNIPPSFGSGLTYFDPFYGLNPFPPPYLLDTVGAPLPITLPAGYSALAPTEIDDFAPYMSIGNILFNTIYPGGDITSLLTPADIWGLPATGLPILPII